jgi:hypothetical protein
MRFSESARRLTGFSTPVFGVSWSPGEAEVVVAHRVITYLEDRRVLYAPWNVEIPTQCVDSVVEIRRYLTHELSSLNDRDHSVAPYLRAMRAACRKFLTLIGNMSDRGEVPEPWSPGTSTWIFNDSLGELRAVFGIHLAQLSSAYGLDVEDELASIFPADVERDDDTSDDEDSPSRWRRWR